MSQGKVTYKGAAGGMGFDYDALVDGNDAIRFWDDFLLPSFQTWANAASGDDTQINDNWQYTQNDGNDTFPVFTDAQEIPGGVLKFTSKAADNDGILLYPGFTVYQPDSFDIAMECRVAISDVANSAFFFGLTENTADGELVADGGAFTAAANGSDRIGIGFDTATTTGKFDVLSNLGDAGFGGTNVAQSATEFDAGATGTLANDEYVRLGVVVRGGISSFYIDGVEVFTSSDASSTSDQPLFPCILMMNDEAGANVFFMDYFGCSAQMNRR
tara:strand:- start:1392 stop:2207 length:816 start_codon:yes stop_codon:yes gene_type:complete